MSDLASPLRVLVVDDNMDCAETLAVFLELLGHEIRVAYDGLEAIRLADAFHPDVALLDIDLPKLDGHEAAKALRERPWAGALTLVAVSGLPDNDRRRSRHSAFHHHLVKPVDHEVLKHVLESVTAS